VECEKCENCSGCINYQKLQVLRKLRRLCRINRSDRKKEMPCRVKDFLEKYLFLRRVDIFYIYAEKQSINPENYNINQSQLSDFQTK
jgi:hypothetical protein